MRLSDDALTDERSIAAALHFFKLLLYVFGFGVRADTRSETNETFSFAHYVGFSMNRAIKISQMFQEINYLNRK